MLKKYPFLAGTLLLTVTGLLSRMIGFFYRIFLSQTIGEEGMGIYQLIAPVMALSFSITAAGIQTAISKFVASETTTHNYKSSFRYLLVGFTISLTLSILTALFLFQNAEYIATYILLEKRCTPLITIYALSLPFSAIHSCANGYYYGIKKASLPALTQLIEQSIRVLSVYLIYTYCLKNGLEIKISIAVMGIVLGEIASMLISVLAITKRFRPYSISLTLWDKKLTPHAGRQIMSMALPLSANRVILNALQSLEAIYIPNRLMRFGLNNSEVLSIYGVLTGMALPLILFPSALTSAISVLLLPYISEAESNKNNLKISNAIRKCIFYCLLMGFCCTGAFFVLGNFLGRFLFNSELAGTFIRSMSFICPFLYLSTILSSILHGLGMAGRTFLLNVASLIIRLIFVFFAIPIFGISAYLWGLLLSELVLCGLQMLALKRYL